MNIDESEELLWEISRLSADAAPPALDDEILVAYRQGELAPAERERVEARLAADGASRRRLAELAGVATPAPSFALRRRLLERLGRRPPVVGWRLAAALLAAVLLAGLGWVLVGRSLPEPGARLAATFEVSVDALAERRSTTGSTAVRPETRVVVRIEPRGEARADVEFGLYRVAGDGVVRVPTEPPIEVVMGRGAAVFTAPAELLVGATPGEHRFYVVAAARGDLPDRLAGTAPDEILSALAAGGRRFVHEHLLLVRQ